MGNKNKNKKRGGEHGLIKEGRLEERGREGKRDGGTKEGRKAKERREEASS